MGKVKAKSAVEVIRAEYPGVAGYAEAAIEAATCRICHRPLKNPKSVLAGIGPDCLRRVRREHAEDPTRPFDTFDWGSMDVELVRGPGGEWLHNLPKVELTLDDGNPRGVVAWGKEGGWTGIKTLAHSVLRLHGPILDRDDRRVDRFASEVVVPIPPEGGVIRGADVRAFLLENPAR
jgi:hypothetical protein